MWPALASDSLPLSLFPSLPRPPPPPSLNEVVFLPLEVRLSGPEEQVPINEILHLLVLFHPGLFLG